MENKSGWWKGGGDHWSVGQGDKTAVRDWPVSDIMSTWMGYPSHDSGHQEKEHVTRKPHGLWPLGKVSELF